MDPVQSGGADYRSGGVEVDVRRRRVVRAGQEVPLEPKACAVLLELLRKAGDVVGRDALLDAVWGHRHVTPAVLSRIVAILRRELRDDADHPRWIRTVHGVGYEFIGELEAWGAEPAPAAASELAPPALPPVPSPQRAWRAVSWLLAALGIATAAVAGWMLWPRSLSAPPTDATAPERGIAVLPLVNASNDKEQQFFSDGLSESLINTLSRFDGLKVIGRDSAFQFRDGKDDSRTVGRKLGVSHLLSGSVQRAGDLVRINASLTRTDDGSTLWAEHYDRSYKDLFALQDEIAQAVAGALKAKLILPDEAASQSDRPPSGDVEAYNVYLQGLKHWHDQDFPEAAESMDKAVRIDPGYAMAWAHLSGSRSTVGTFWNESPELAREHTREARLAADKALQLAPGLGAAHAALAYLQFYDFDHRGALAECRSAVQLAPRDGTVLNGCAYVLAGIGKLGEAIQLRERLLSIEPLYGINDFQYARLLAASGRLDEAEKYLRTADGLGQPNRLAHLSAHLTVALLRGDAKAAQDVAQDQPSPQREMILAMAKQISPDRAAADAALAYVLENKAWTNVGPYPIAQAHALRDDPEGTVEWLERAPAGDILFMLIDPLILRFRDDPRLIAFCKKIGLPPPGESEALGIDQIRAALAAKR